MSHDRGCPCGKEGRDEYTLCEDVSCMRRTRKPLLTAPSEVYAVPTEDGFPGTVSGRMSASKPNVSNAPKTDKYDADWADRAERSEWAFIALALQEAEKYMTANISWISVATKIAEERSNNGWRNYK